MASARHAGRSGKQQQVSTGKGAACGCRGCCSSRLDEDMNQLRASPQLRKPACGHGRRPGQCLLPPPTCSSKCCDILSVALKVRKYVVCGLSEPQASALLKLGRELIDIETNEVSSIIFKALLNMLQTCLASVAWCFVHNLAGASLSFCLRPRSVST